MLSKDHYLAIAGQKYDKIVALEKITDFYDYEKTFVEVWQGFGKEILERSISDVPNDRRKKKLLPNLEKLK